MLMKIFLNFLAPRIGNKVIFTIFEFLYRHFCPRMWFILPSHNDWVTYGKSSLIIDRFEGLHEVDLAILRWTAAI